MVLEGVSLKGKVRGGAQLDNQEYATYHITMTCALVPTVLLGRVLHIWVLQ